MGNDEGDAGDDLSDHVRHDRQALLVRTGIQMTIIATPGLEDGT